MQTAWYFLIAFMLTAYVVLDGFDLGAGLLQPMVAKTDEERRTILAAIGPLWDANEVWLIAAGGVLVFAFPKVYAAAFSGFYLPLMMVLWLLVLRGISIEFRSHVENPTLTASNASSGEKGLVVGLRWWIPAIALAVFYFAYLFRSFRAKVTLTDSHY